MSPQSPGVPILVKPSGGAMAFAAGGMVPKPMRATMSNRVKKDISFIVSIKGAWHAKKGFRAKKIHVYLSWRGQSRSFSTCPSGGTLMV